MPSTNREPSFAELLRDPDVREHVEVAGSVGVFAPHGGRIEVGTAEIARAIARQAGSTLYALSAHRRTGNRALHVTSTKMIAGVSAKLDAALAACRVAIAIHGHGCEGALERAMFVSGVATHERDVLVASLRATLGTRWEIIDDPARIPAHLRGLHPENFVNRATHGGVQIELPHALRDPQPRPSGDALVFVAAIAGAIARLSAGGE